MGTVQPAAPVHAPNQPPKTAWDAAGRGQRHDRAVVVACNADTAAVNSCWHAGDAAAALTNFVDTQDEWHVGQAEDNWGDSGARRGDDPVAAGDVIGDDKRVGDPVFIGEPAERRHDIQPGSRGGGCKAEHPARPHRLTKCAAHSHGQWHWEGVPAAVA